jgi:alkylation response protein AidB-like acyl-CoA dehydrogenase
VTVEAPAVTTVAVAAECSTWPLPGSGATVERWQRLAALGRRDLALAKVVEPHHDAVAIMAELGDDPPADGEVWAVWAAEPPFAVLSAAHGAGGWRVDGRTAFCSGVGVVSHALVTAQTPEGSRLFAISLDADGVRVDPDGPVWAGRGMQRALTQTLVLDDVPARPVGAAGDYTGRPGFWLGAIGIAACWFGGTQRVADTLEDTRDRLGPHGLAHLGAVRAGIDTFELALQAAATAADAGLTMPRAERLALAMRSRAADLVDDVIARVGRATGPGPLAFDEQHARHVADLQVFVRQHHAERDLETLGRLS